MRTEELATSTLPVSGLQLSLLRKNTQDKSLLFQDFSSFYLFLLFSPVVIWKCGVGQSGNVRKLVGVMLQSRSLNKFSRKGKETIKVRQDARSGRL